MQYFLYVLAAIESVAIIYTIIMALRKLREVLYNWFDNKMECIARDKLHENNVASYLFFFQDMGPNISSFSVIALFISSKEDTKALILVFFAGIMIKEISRKMKNAFYSDIRRRQEEEK